MDFAFDKIDAAHRYKLLIGLVVPRPIAWVTSLNENSSINAAPFSFFNVLGSDPGIVAISIGNHPDRPKDTAKNIDREQEFVVNLVALRHSQSMSDSATDYPPDISEIEELSISTAPSKFIKTPRIATSPASFECRLERIIEIGKNRIVLGEVLSIHVDDRHVKDAHRCHIDTGSLELIGRMGGAGAYCTTKDEFEIARKSYGTRN